MKITVTDDNNKVLFEKESTELIVSQVIAGVTAACRTQGEQLAHAMAQVAAIKARRTPAQAAEADRVAALSPEDRAVEFATQEKERLEAQLAVAVGKVQTLQAVSLKAAPVEKAIP